LLLGLRMANDAYSASCKVVSTIIIVTKLCLNGGVVCKYLKCLHAPEVSVMSLMPTMPVVSLVAKVTVPE